MQYKIEAVDTEGKVTEETVSGDELTKVHHEASLKYASHVSVRVTPLEADIKTGSSKKRAEQ